MYLQRYVSGNSNFPLLWGKIKSPAAAGLYFDTTSCDSVGARTRDLLLRRQLLYPTELPNRPCCSLRVQR